MPALATATAATTAAAAAAATACAAAPISCESLCTKVMNRRAILLNLLHLLLGLSDSPPLKFVSTLLLLLLHLLVLMVLPRSLPIGRIPILMV